MQVHKDTPKTFDVSIDGHRYMVELRKVKNGARVTYRRDALHHADDYTDPLLAYSAFAAMRGALIATAATYDL